ncbi:coproporphyrinogen III oxidase, anaerobic [Alkalispirochaeta americana]|uniref:Coproporphyrinogen III oxidase, anaerobic n=1 Tax=Alkalispirochaeta americana TaxID=159291 RepID=A0A1N6P9J5_9SPIO|nr:coproporphyrinogen-III oxidase family protein [Alkalispirochaeta americana]SIQ01048.1 coproporphyrinogen III oxidase, anaerobic [Alkalispirochaeta americana]
MNLIGGHLYIHIPFCRSRCDYCDFYTRCGVSEKRQNEVVEAISRQAEELLPLLLDETPSDYPPGQNGLPGQDGLSGSVPGASAPDTPASGGAPLATMYLGGGTPSALVPTARKKLFALVRRLGLAKEATLEANPEDITPQFLEEASQAGINRLSVGVQSLDAGALQRIGRKIDPDTVQRGIDLVHNHWRDAAGKQRRWSADIIAGIPGRNNSALQQDLEGVLAAGADHLSVYELTLEPETPLGRDLRRGTFRTAPEEEILAERAFLDHLLRGRGFSRYEVSSYALPDSESHHNCAYWQMRPYLGIGPGAVGTILSPSPRRLTNTRDLALYCSDPSRGLEIEEISPTDYLKEVIMMGFRTRRGISRRTFLDRFGAPLESFIPETLDRWKVPIPGAKEDRKEGDASEGWYRLAPRHWMLLDTFLREAFREINETGNAAR